jgi:acetyl esterase/lipase
MSRRAALGRLAAPPLLAPLLAACTPAGLAGALTPRGGGTVRRGLSYGAGLRRALDLYLPAAEARADTPLVVFFYGGSWQTGRREDYAFLGRTLAARGIAVAVPDYRLWPETRWPGFLEDGAGAVAWLRRGGAGDVPAGAPVFLMGHSAGGFIAAALALDPRWLGGTERAGLAGCATLAAPFDWTPRRDPLASIFAPAPGGAIRAVAQEDPAALVAAPPMLLLHGAEDRTVRPEQSERMAARLRAAGAREVRLRVLPGVGHISILSAMAAPLRALGLTRAPVLEEVAGFVAGTAAGA